MLVSLRRFLFIFLLFPGLSTLAQTPDTVQIGCYVISMHDFDFRDKEYTARFWLWTLYKNPEIHFERAVEIPNAKSFEIDQTIIDTLAGKQWVQLKLRCVMKESWNIANFPFDRQQLKILVENSKFDNRNLIFVADTNGLFYDPELSVDGWNVSDFKVSTGTSHYATGFGDSTLEKPQSDYSKFVISLQLERNAWGLFFKLFLGMYVAFMISYVSFFIDPQHVDPRFGLPVGGLFAAVGNKYIIDGYLPDSPTLTIVDILHGLTFLSIFVIIAFSALSLRQEETGFVAHSKRTDRLLRLILGGVYLLVNVGMIGYALFSNS
jgi:hypothetical protein